VAKAVAVAKAADSVEVDSLQPQEVEMATP
jgi:hypothetical protein